MPLPPCRRRSSFDFFHTAPYLTLQIDSDDDVETTVLLLAVGLVVGHSPSCRQRRATPARDAADEIRRIHRVAALVGGRSAHAGGHDPGRPDTSSAELLGLRSCQFEALPFSHSLPGWSAAAWSP